MTRHLNIITNSSSNTYLMCPRKYRFRYIDHIVPRSEYMPFAFGTAGHAWLETYWTGKPCALPTLSDPFEQAKLRAMLKGYSLRWSEWLEDFVEVTGCEIEFRVPLVNPDTGAKSPAWEVCGKLDAFGRFTENGTKRYLVGEHKFTSDAGVGYFERLRIDSQISTYLMGCKANGLPEPEGVLYDVAKKPGLDPLKATPVENRKYTKPTKAEPESRLYANQRDRDETPDEYEQRCFEAIAEKPEEYYQHALCVRLDSEVTEAARDMWFIAGMIRESMNRDRWPRNTQSCRNQYQKFCEYWPICTGECSADDTVRFEKRRPFEELSEGLTQ